MCHPPISRHGLGLVLFVFAMMPGASRAKGDDLPRGVAVAVGDVRKEDLLADLHRVGGAAWIVEHVAPQAPVRSSSTSIDLEGLRALYWEANFLECVRRVQDASSTFDLLLDRGQIAQASELIVLAASCMQKAGDASGAGDLLRRALVSELDLTGALKETTPTFQAFVERMRAETENLERVHLSLATDPPGAKIAIDGRRELCAQSPCVATFLPGIHLLVTERLGFRRDVRSNRFSENGDLKLVLAPIDAAGARAQLSEAIALGAAPESVEIAQLASTAFASRVVIVAWMSSGKPHAVLYDHVLGRIVARASAEDRAGLELVVKSVVQEWSGELEPPTSFVSSPVLWILAGAVALAAGGATVYLLSRSEEHRYAIVFP